MLPPDREEPLADDLMPIEESALERFLHLFPATLGTGLTLGMVDLVVGFSTRPQGLMALLVVCRSALAVTLLSALVFTVIRLGLLSPPARRFLPLEEAITIPVVVALVVTGTLYAIVRLSIEAHATSITASAFQLGLVSVYAVLVLLGTAVAARWAFATPLRADLAVGLGLAAPAIVTIVATYLWLKGSMFQTQVPRPLQAGVAVVIVAVLAAAAFGPGRLALAGAQLLLVVALVVGAIPRTTLGKLGTSPRVRADIAMPYVFLITAGTLRADAVSANGSSWSPTPGLDALAGEGVRFTNARASAPWGLPALGSLLTGLTPAVLTGEGQGARMPSSVPTLARTLVEAGYRTAAFGVPIVVDKAGLAQGFQAVQSDVTSASPPTLGVRLVLLVTGASRGTRTYDRLSDWLGTNRGRPLFCWIHEEGRSTGVGRRAAVPAGFFAPGLDARRSAHAERAAAIDRRVAGLVELLKELELYERSLVVFVGIHGDSLVEDRRSRTDRTLDDARLRVPLIFKLPGTGEARVLENPVVTTRLPATILSLCLPKVQSTGMAAPMAGLGSSPPAAGEVSYLAGSIASIVRKEAILLDQLKYVVDVGSGREELFDLAADPGETRSVAAAHPAEVERARQLLDQQRREAGEARRYYGIGRAKAGGATTPAGNEGAPQEEQPD